MLEVRYMKNDEGEFELDNSFSWELIDFKEYSMDIQLNFENPLEVSTEESDRVRVVFKDTSLLYDYFG